MSTTTSQHDGPDESQDADDLHADDDEDDDLDAALFGNDSDAEDAEAPAPVSSGQASENQKTPLQDEDDDIRRRDDERNRVVMGLMTDEQLDRYEAYRRSGVSPANLRKVVQAVCGHNVSKNMITVVRGLAKVFVGEIVETAALIAHEQGDSLPLQPIHYRAAYQQLRLSGKVPRQDTHKRLRL